ncbi:hypothetical protein BO94DRAFT_622654 [Aspergillus sclerotioniger CBS 115572]|uniref:Uncharacterized protein n=1 Tax=Aspergillus sclerotioniger CBS 115572 TaxID=1450535 RepID=A0A317WZQ0_9EURO|nr:hypothetical protein BO94DRAFT_622654 [Aspergillus sclerotioniger CBS 115572]PWY91866.1 hypothetical protein BO94DRAFT_622654 [Aspergillus sclerotioniger CBS 115572]
MAPRNRKLALSVLPHLLDAQRKLFSDIDDDLVDRQKQQLRSCLQLWRSDDSSTRKWANTRARSLLAMVYEDKYLGAPVFILCALGISVTKLGTLNPVEAIAEIRKWWRNVEHPAGLIMCSKRYVQENWDVFSIFKGQASPTPPPTIVYFTIPELFNFFQSKASSPNLQMTCPISGQPLPTIEIDLNGRSAKIEFSLRASQALIQHKLISQAADGKNAQTGVESTDRFVPAI